MECRYADGTSSRRPLAIAKRHGSGVLALSECARSVAGIRVGRQLLDRLGSNWTEGEGPMLPFTRAVLDAGARH